MVLEIEGSSFNIANFALDDVVALFWPYSNSYSPLPKGRDCSSAISVALERFGSGDDSIQCVLKDGNKLAGLLRVSRSHWESHHFGIAIGSLACFAQRNISVSLLASAISEVVVMSESILGVEKLVCGSPLVHASLMSALSQAGFFIADIRGAFYVNGGRFSGTKAPLGHYIHDFEPGHMGALMSLCHKIQFPSRFFNDGDFARDAVLSMYEKWIERSAHGEQDSIMKVIVSGGDLVGFGCMQGVESVSGFLAARAYGNVLAGAVPGYGRFTYPLFDSLTRAALLSRPWVEAVISLGNLLPINIVESLGYRMGYSEAIFHKTV